MNYKNIRLDKSLYKAEGGFSRQLERLDPSENYKSTDLSGLDAFERQLKRFDIKVSGPSSDPIAKFFQTSDSAALFPEYVARAVGKGANDAEVLSDIVASTTEINSLDYRSITTDLDRFNDHEMDEGDPLPEVSIQLTESLIRLKKRGRILSASYEAIKHQRTDVLTVALKQIGYSLAKAQLEDAVRMLLIGEGTVPEAEVIYTGSSEPLFDNLLDLWNRFADFQLNVILASANTVRQLLSMEELADYNTGNTFVSTGSLITPFGAKIIKTEAIDDGVLLGLDKNFALEMVTSGGIQVEYDKLIDTQLERAAISSIYGFSKLFPDAVKVMVFE